ncbi:MAG: hypothetical protein V1734_03430 [Nanoarchaeota archaeon]
MEAKQFKPSRISIDVNITDKTNPEQLANNVEFFLNQLKERGIVASVGGITTQFKGEEE